MPELEPAEQVGNDGEVVGEHGHKELVPAESLRIRVSPRQSESSLRVRLIGLSGEELVRGPRSHRMIRSIKGALSESLLLPSAESPGQESVPASCISVLRRGNFRRLTRCESVATRCKANIAITDTEI